MERENLTAPERSRRTLERGVIVYRWVALGWMATAAGTTTEDFRNVALAWASIGAAAMWTAWLTVGGGRSRSLVLYFDLALSLWLTLVSGLVVFPEDIVEGRPFFAVGYPYSTILLWGVQRGPLPGLVAGVVLGGGYLLARPINGVPFDEFDGRQIEHVTGTLLNFLAAGAVAGFISRLLARSAEALRVATEETIREGQKSARLAERESLARQIHDSVLQALALVHKRGRELAAGGTVPGAEVARLAEIAAQQEVQLRRLMTRAPEEPPTGRASLRDTLEATARSVEGLDTAVSTVGPIWLERACVEEVAAATKQALCNVAEHAGASHAQVFAEYGDQRVVVSVRDDGVGFRYEEDDLRSAGKAGILKSMKGRIEDLGGTMTISSEPGKGTEVEFVVPVTEEVDGA